MQLFYINNIGIYRQLHKDRTELVPVPWSGHLLQEASTAKLLVIPLHGSSPNVSADTPMLQLLFPMQSCRVYDIEYLKDLDNQIQNPIKQNHWRIRTFCTTVRASLLLHRPWLKLPHFPCGVPKLANFIPDIIWFGRGQWSDKTAPALFVVSSSDETHVSIGIGWVSETWEHMLSVSLVAKDICVGSPPISSNNTRMFALGCSQERGTW